MTKQSEAENVAATPKKANPFANFVKENYKHVRTPGSSHKETMKTLSQQFAKTKINWYVISYGIFDICIRCIWTYIYAQAQPINCHYYWLTQPLCLTVPDGRYSFSPHTQAHKQQLLLNTLHDRVIQADDFKWRWNSNLKLKTPTKSVYSNLVLLQIDAIRQTAPCRYSCNKLFLLFSWQWSSVWIHCHTSATGWFLPLHCSLTVSVVSQINRSGGGKKSNKSH